MQTKDWPRVEELFHKTLQLGAAERAAYLESECAGDERLRWEVESLVAAFESEHSFIEQPVLSLGMKVLSDGLAGSLLGRSIGHYKIVRLLGKGGMGEVYLAEDCVLERPVALKFLANCLVDDEEAKSQVMQEARAVAKLENPNICAIHSLEEIEGHNFIVMQYVEGETLASLLRRERLSLERVLDLAEQIAAALSAAHARGIIHRDVKPQNIIVSEDGRVKVLDFGLAKFVRQKQDTEHADKDRSRTSKVEGVMGTVPYMAPEQTRGEELDYRSDIFSFGIILYEMLGARNPFLRETVAETISAIQSDDPPPSALPPDLPKALQGVAQKCLEKEREQRYETVDQLLSQLRVVRAGRARPVTMTLRERILHNPYYLKRAAAAALVLIILFIVGARLIYVRATEVHTLAVLPIANKSADSNMDYLSDGLTRNLFDKFSYLPRLRVKMPSIIPHEEDRTLELVKAGRELKVEAVLSGELIKKDESLLLHIVLLNTANGAQLWEQTFNVGAVNLFTLQDEITSETVSKLGLWLIGDEHKLLTKRQTDSQEALNLYMRGRYYWALKRDREKIQTAVHLFERAVNLDPAFAKAYTGLADSYALMTSVAYGPIDTKEAMAKARWNARQAIELDESLSEAHTSMGLIRLRFDWDWVEAEREFKRAIELDPEYAPARFWYANLLAARGRFDESVRESEAAREFDPYSSLADMNYGRALYYARRFDEAAAYFSKKLEERPDYPQFLHMMGYVLLQQGKFDEAIAKLEKLHSTKKLHAAAALGYAYGRAGRNDDALRMIRELDELSKIEVVAPFEKALVYIGMDRRDEAFSLLNESYNQRLPNLANLATDPLYDHIRSDSRFADLTRRVNLTP